jgi:hypothetical protein
MAEIRISGEDFDAWRSQRLKELQGRSLRRDQPSEAAVWSDYELPYSGRKPALTEQEQIAGIIDKATRQVTPAQERVKSVLFSRLTDDADTKSLRGRDTFERLAETLRQANLSEVKRTPAGKPVQKIGGIGNIIETPSAPTAEQQAAASQTQQNWKKERDSYDFLALGNIGGKGSPVEPSPAKQGGIGKVRYIGDPFDSRRNTPVPQAQNIPGLPSKTSRPLKSPWPFQTPGKAGDQLQQDFADEQPTIEKVNRRLQNKIRTEPVESQTSGQIQESNLAKILRGEANSGIVRQASMLSGRFENVRKEPEGGTYKPRRTRPPREIPGDIIAQTPTGTVGGERKYDRQERINQIPYSKGTDGPAYDLMYGDYVGGFKRNAGELDDLQRSIYQKTQDQLDNPGNDPVDPSTVNVQKKSGEIGPAFTLDVVERGGDKQLKQGGTVDPTRIVEQRTVNPDATASFLRDKEISLGKRAQEIKNEFKTRLIGGNVLNEKLRKGQLTRAENLSKEQLIKAGVNPNKIGSFIGIMRSLKTDPRASVKANAQLQPSAEMGVSAAGLRARDRGVEETNIYRAMDTRTGEQLKTERINSNLAAVEELLYRVGRPTALDNDAVREALAELDGSTISGRAKRGALGRRAKTTITQQELDNAINRGQIQAKGREGDALVIARKDGSTTKLIPFTDQGRTGYYVSDSFESYATGPAPTLTQRGDAATEVKVKGIRTKAEELGGQKFNQYIDALAKGALTQQPVEGTQRALNDLANIILNGPELGVSDEQVKLIYNDFAARHPEGSNARTLLNQALIEQSAGGREVDLFSEEAIGPDADYGKSSTADIQEMFEDAPIEKPYDEATNGGSDNGEMRKEVYNGNGYGLKGDDYISGTRFGEEGRNPIGAGDPKWRGTGVNTSYMDADPRFGGVVGRGLTGKELSLADEIRAKYLPPSNALNAPVSSNGEIPYKDYRAVANLTGAELGSDLQNRAMAIQAQRIAKLRRGL